MMATIFQWMQQLYEALGSTSQLSPWVYLLVTAGGLASALSPCYVPVLGMFGGYIGGYAESNKGGGLRLAVPFIVGNAVMLALVGAVASILGNSVLSIFTNYQLDRWIPGVVGLLMGFQLLGVIKLKMPVMPIFRWPQQPSTAFGAFALGLPFGLVVTPCTIPIFFAIVAFVATQGSVMHGTLLMVSYALGRGGVLLAVAVSIGLLKSLNISRTSLYVERISGALILVLSVALLVFYNGFVASTMPWRR